MSSVASAAGRIAAEQPAPAAAVAGQSQSSSAAAAAADLAAVESAEAAAAAAVTDFRALGYQASAAAAAAAAGWHVSGYQAALAVLEDMAAAGVTPGVDTYTLFIHHMVQVRRCCGWPAWQLRLSLCNSWVEGGVLARAAGLVVRGGTVQPAGASQLHRSSVPVSVLQSVRVSAAVACACVV
jgi:hypothetical protein